MALILINQVWRHFPHDERYKKGEADVKTVDIIVSPFYLVSILNGDFNS